MPTSAISPFPAMILAAGLGERMRPLTERTPKPLLEVGGKALIVWQIERLRAAGFRALVINHAHLGAAIELALKDGAAWDTHIRYSREAAPLETAGGIATALPLLGDGPFVVVNADVYTDFDYARLLPVLRAMADADAPLAHLVLVDNPPHHADGDFALVDGRVCARDSAPALTFSGIACYRAPLFADIPPGSKAKLAPLLHAAVAAGRVTGEHHAGRWEDVGTPARLHALDLQLRDRENALAV
jgi:MurNAc alpha-1-phosphate uridylyltransferase